MGKLKIHTSYGKQDAVIIDPTPWQVIYVETDYDETVNAFIRNNYDAICKAFDEVGYEFCYVPRLSEDIGNDEMVSYYAPYLSKRVSRLSTPDILSYIGIEDKCIGSALKIIDNAKSIDGVVAFTTISFDGYADCLDSFFDDVVALLKHVEVDYCYEQYALTHMIDYDEDEEPEDFADSRFYSEDRKSVV